MSDTQEAMREFRFLDEKRKLGGLSPAEEERWAELRALLGLPEAAAAPADAYGQQPQGYYAADGNWYPYPPGYAPYPQYGYPQGYDPNAYAQGYDPNQAGYPPGYDPNQAYPQGYPPEAGYDPNAYPQGYDPNQQYPQGYAPQGGYEPAYGYPQQGCYPQPDYQAYPQGYPPAEGYPAYDPNQQAYPASGYEHQGYPQYPQPPLAPVAPEVPAGGSWQPEQQQSASSLLNLEGDLDLPALTETAPPPAAPPATAPKRSPLISGLNLPRPPTNAPMPAAPPSAVRPMVAAAPAFQPLGAVKPRIPVPAPNTPAPMEIGDDDVMEVDSDDVTEVETASPLARPSTPNTELPSLNLSLDDEPSAPSLASLFDAEPVPAATRPPPQAPEVPAEKAVEPEPALPSFEVSTEDDEAPAADAREAEAALPSIEVSTDEDTRAPPPVSAVAQISAPAASEPELPSIDVDTDLAEPPAPGVEIAGRPETGEGQPSITPPADTEQPEAELPSFDVEADSPEEARLPEVTQAAVAAEAPPTPAPSLESALFGEPAAQEAELPSVELAADFAEPTAPEPELPNIELAADIAEPTAREPELPNIELAADIAEPPAAEPELPSIEIAADIAEPPAAEPELPSIEIAADIASPPAAEPELPSVELAADLAEPAAREPEPDLPSIEVAPDFDDPEVPIAAAAAREAAPPPAPPALEPAAPEWDSVPIVGGDPAWDGPAPPAAAATDTPPAEWGLPEAVPAPALPPTPPPSARAASPSSGRDASGFGAAPTELAPADDLGAPDASLFGAAPADLSPEWQVAAPPAAVPPDLAPEWGTGSEPPEPAAAPDEPVIDLLESDADSCDEPGSPDEPVLGGDSADAVPLAQNSEFIGFTQPAVQADRGLDLGGEDSAGDFAASLLPSPSALAPAAGPDTSPDDRLELASASDFIGAPELVSTGNPWSGAPAAAAAPEPSAAEPSISLDWDEPPAAPVPAPVVAPAAPLSAAARYPDFGGALGGPLSASFAEGEHRVTVHTVEGQVKRGTIRDLDLMEELIPLEQQVGFAPEMLPLKRIKAIFFMLPAGARPPPIEGQKLRITFVDGRQVAGFSTSYQGDEPGFFIVPADNRTNIARIFVYRTSVRAVAVA